MRIFPISLNKNNYQQTRNTKQSSNNFTGVIKEVSQKFVRNGSFGGDQGDFEEYLRTVEYHPFKDESIQEISENVKKITKTDTYTPKGMIGHYSYHTAYPTTTITNTVVQLGETLNCTKEEAQMIMNSSDEDIIL